MNTPYFRARCNSMLRYIALKDKVNNWSIDEDEVAVVRQLIRDNKIKQVPVGDLVAVDCTPYENTHTQPGGWINPIVLELATENPANENFVQVYRKNLDRLAIAS